MGLISSICKRKKHDYDDTIVQNNYTQTTLSTGHPSSSISSEKTQCSAISREPMKTSSRCHYYFPSQQQISGYPDFPIFSTPFYLPYNDKNNFSFDYSNPYIAKAYSHNIRSRSPSIHHIDQTRTTRATSTPESYRIPTVSDMVQTTNNDIQTITHVDSSVTTDTNEEISKENLDDGARQIKRSVSVPIDMFLIDISNEQVLIGQPISMNIRHLLLDTLENRCTNSPTSIRIEPSTITTYAHENLFKYIPYVCERYPNVTVDADQLTRNTLHIRVPSEFPHSINLLT